MTIDVRFNCERNEEIIEALKGARGNWCIIDQLCKEHGEASVLNALYHASDDEDWPNEPKYYNWEDRIQEWLYEYFYDDCMSYLFDAVFGEDR